jgi:N-methylhydantoinase B
MGDHMPVHLGSMPMSVRAAIEAFPKDLHPGDAVMLNDPFAGGTHLPDITVVMPVFVAPKRERDARDTAGKMPALQKSVQRSAVRKSAGRPDFYVASRAHHADVGGTFPGSMGLCEEIYQEGLRIPPVKIMRGGKVERDVLALLLNNVRTPEEREGDLGAQIAACNAGADRLRDVCRKYSLPRVTRAMENLQDYADELMRAFLSRVPEGEYAAEEFLDDDGVSDDPVRIAIKLSFRGRGDQRRVVVDFNGSSPQTRGSINAVEAITYSACFYVFRCLAADDVPAAAGLMRAIEVIAPRGTVVNAVPPAAVAGGNVETSQRIVDTLLRALAKAVPDRIPAGSSGTMNNLTIGGMDNRPAAEGGYGSAFAYYETIAGGMGARPTKDGPSGVHTHMTNSLNTPAEALEHAYPLRVTEYSIRKGSGGRGKSRGGDGIVREIELLSDAQVTVLADRRKCGPYGLNDASDGVPGKNEVVRADGSRAAIPTKGSVRLRRGERVRIESPGGGGWGKPIG